MARPNSNPTEGLSLAQAAGLIDEVLNYCSNNTQYACVSVYQERLHLKA